MPNLFDSIHIVSTYGYVGLFAIVFIENGIFFLLPGDSLIFTAGLLAPALGFNIILLTLLIFIAAFLGGLAGYYIGTKLDHLYRFAIFRKILKKEHLDKAHTFFLKHGLSAILISRFLPVVRTFLPIVAGMARMKYSDFVRYSILGSAIWSVAFTFGGYFLGKTFPHLVDYLLYVVVIIVFLSILPGFIQWLRIRRK